MQALAFLRSERIVMTTIVHQYQLMPELASDEYAALKDDIARRCVQVPVEYDEQGNILDGHHRVRACMELGIKDWPRVVRVGMTQEQKIEHVLSLNLNRRHLTREQRQEIVVRLRAEGWSTRRIADKLKVDPMTVHHDLQRVDISTPVAITGMDGKQYPAKRPATPPVSLFNPSQVKVRQASEMVDAIQHAPDDWATLNKDLQRGNVTGAYREFQRAKDAESVQIVTAPDGKYRTIVIDPPWDWGDEGDVSQMGRGIPKYATMPIDDIERLPITDLADENCHLYLWITNRSLPKGFRLIESWGFRYIAPLTWCKPSIGIGNYFRNNTEHILFAVKGSQRLLRFDVGTWFTAERGDEHSVKPNAAYDIIASCSPAPRLDMFARREREGFVVWGNL